MEATEVDVLDNKQVGACLAKINNQIIKMRFAVKKGKAWALKELFRKIRKIKTEDTKKEDRKTIKNRKMVRLEEEVAAIKALDCDAIALYALERVREEDLVKVMGSDPPMDRRAKARVAHTKNVKDVVDRFAVAFPEYTRFITLFAARKEKGVGAKKHAKGKKKTQNNVETDKDLNQTNDKNRLMKEKESDDDESSFVSSEEKEKAAGAKKKLANSTLVTLAQKDDNRESDDIRDKNFSNEEGKEFAPAEKSISTSNDVFLPNETPRVTNSQDEKDDGDDDIANKSDGSDDDSDAIEFDRQILSDDEVDEINRDYDGGVSEDGGDSDDGESDDDLSGDEGDVEDNEMTQKREQKSEKQNAISKSTVPPRPPNRSMVVTRINLEEADSGFVKVDAKAKNSGERKGSEDDNDDGEDEDTETPSHSVDPFFAGGSSSSAVKRKLEEEEIDEEDFEDRFSDYDDYGDDEDRDDKGGGDLSSAFVGLRGNSSDSRGRERGRGVSKRGRADFREVGRGSDRGGRGGERGGRGGERGGRGMGRGRGDFGRGGGFGRGRGDFNRGTDRGRGSFDRGGRGRGDFSRGTDRGRGSFDRGGRGRGSFDNPKPPPMDETNLHPSWQAKRKQKVQISATSSQAGKKITFDD